MDVTQYLDARIAPRAIFDKLEERRDRVRYVTAEGLRVTYGEHAAAIRAIASYLRKIGLRAGDRAAIYAPNRVEWMTAALAIQAAGGVMVPIYPSSTAEQAAYVIAHSDAKVVFVDTPPLVARLAEVRGRLGAVIEHISLSSSDRQAARSRALPPAGSRALPPAGSPALRRDRVTPWSEALLAGVAIDASDPAAFERVMHGVSLDQSGLMLYTSGTSGNPKGVPLTHRNVAVNGADWLRINAPAIDEGTIDLLWLPMSHIFGFGEACLGNALGWTTYLADPLTVLSRLPEVRPHVLMSVPRVWEKLAAAVLVEGTPERRRARLHALTGGRLSFCLSGGAGLKREIKDLFHACGVLLIEGYGLTECSPTLTLNRPDDFRFDSVGKALPSVEIKLAPDGEILARGGSVFRGYHKDAAATREAFTHDGWFKTGDIGRFTEDGFLQIVDRKKDILVTAGGKNVPPANIEVRFDGDPFLAHVVVYGEGKPYLVAGVWLADPSIDPAQAEPMVAERIAAVNERLASYEAIKRFTVVRSPLTVDAGLLTPTLKVKRKKVYERFRDDFERLYG
jgi:long-chain acyl-CoA synthetase